MKFGRILVLSIATLLVAVPAVHAQDDMGDLTTKRPAKKQTVEEENNDPARSGPILGLGATYALDNFSNLGMDTNGSGGFNVHVGYRFNKYVATELEVEKYVQFDGDVPSPPGNPNHNEVNAWALGVNERGYVLSGRYQPFGEIGLNYLKTETTNTSAANVNKTDDGPALRFGAGMDFYATPKIVVTGDISYMLGLGDVQDYDLIAFSLGFAYRP